MLVYEISYTKDSNKIIINYNDEYQIKNKAEVSIFDKLKATKPGNWTDCGCKSRLSQTYKVNIKINFQSNKLD